MAPILACIHVEIHPAANTRETGDLEALAAAGTAELSHTSELPRPGNAQPNHQSAQYQRNGQRNEHEGRSCHD
jgi:hypothetical protein